MADQDCRAWRRQLKVLCGWSLALGLTGVVGAREPEVRFDFPPTIACQPVHDEALVAAHPGEALYEARLDVSTLLVSGAAADWHENILRLTSPQQSFFVVDYAPRTTLASDYNGGIVIENKTDTSQGLGLALSSPWQPVDLSGHGELSSKQCQTTRYELAAPQQPVTTSGTIQHGRGVYFKMRRSRQTTLEGGQEFRVVLRVPAGWRGDFLDVMCEARGIDRGMMKQFDEPARCGYRQASVALYRAGDSQAQAIAERYTASWNTFRTAALNHRDQPQHRGPTSFLRELNGLFDGADASSPEDLLDLVSHASANNSEPHIPDKVRSAAALYLAAQRQLRDLKD